MTTIIFAVLGKPVQQGSKRWLPNGRMKEHNDSELRPWRATVTAAAMQEMRKTPGITYPLTGPVRVTMEFVYVRTKGHYGTGRNAGVLKPNAPTFVTKTPDLDKLVRSVNDSITDSGLWKDDSQVVVLEATKRYGANAGVVVTITELEQS